MLTYCRPCWRLVARKLFCLLKFRCITLKMLNSSKTINTLSCLAYREVTHQTTVQEVPGSISRSDMVSFMFVFLFCCYFVFSFLIQKTFLSWIVAIPFALLFYLVYLTYCKVSDQLKGYEDKYIVSLIVYRCKHISAKLRSSPLLVHAFCSCDKVNHKQEVRFLLYLLGQIVTWQL